MKLLTQKEFEALRRGAAQILGTNTTPVVVPGEAILGIEGLARCAGGPGRRFLNLVSGPYGKAFGDWLRECGSQVRDLEVPWDRTVDPEEVRRALREEEPEALSYVYAEAVTGGANPAKEIQEAAREAGVYTLVDAVSSFGADPFFMDNWGVDFVSMGMQKALLGSNGISFLGVSERGMAWLRENGAAPIHSILSIPEMAEVQEREIPQHLSVLEARETLEAFSRIRELGGVAALVERHHAMAELVRRQVRELGYELFQREEQGCTDLNTTVRLPETGAARAFTGEGIVAPGDWELAGKVLRINHYGEQCREEAVAAAMETLRRLQ